MRSTVQKRRSCLSVGKLTAQLGMRSLNLEYVIKSVTAGNVTTSGSVMDIDTINGTGVTAILAYLLITFVITIKTVTMVMMRVTVVM